MSPNTRLHHLVIGSAARTPDAVAVTANDGDMTYGELDRAANRVARALAAMGVNRGDRVAMWLPKSIRAVVVMQALLRLGAAYVPIDPLSPVARAAKITAGSGARVVVCTADRAEALTAAADGEPPAFLLVDDQDVGSGAVTWSAAMARADDDLADPDMGADDLAYILYTSGSTGEPKGVCISHRNAMSFVAWAAGNIGASAADRFSNHAPFHFDLSVFDLYVAFFVGGSVHVVPDGSAYAPAVLVEFLRQKQITVWYSVPSVLMMMAADGDLFEAEVPALRVIVFAGEPYPVKHLRALWQHFGERVRLFNYYGPTETNVCTAYEVHDIDPDRITPVPIGAAASFDTAWVVKEDGTRAEIGEQGELVIDGPTVMLGYFGRPPQSGAPYRTGDKVRVLPDGEYEYVGRLDHMVKVRGHRVELGEIEAALSDHPGVQDAVVVTAGTGMEKRLHAFLIAHNGTQLSLLDAKRHCAERVPRYMIVDKVEYLAELPRTRNGKIDRNKLSALAGAT